MFNFVSKNGHARFQVMDQYRSTGDNKNKPPCQEVKEAAMECFLSKYCKLVVSLTSYIGEY